MWWLLWHVTQSPGPIAPNGPAAFLLALNSSASRTWHCAQMFATESTPGGDGPVAAMARDAGRRRRIAAFQQRLRMDARGPLVEDLRRPIEGAHPRLVGMTGRARLRHAVREHRRSRVAHRDHAMGVMTIAAGGDAGFALGHLPAVHAGLVLRVLIDAQLGRECSHVGRVGMTLRAEPRNRRSGDRRVVAVGPFRPVTRVARQPRLRMHVVFERRLRLRQSRAGRRGRRCRDRLGRRCLLAGGADGHRTRQRDDRQDADGHRPSIRHVCPPDSATTVMATMKASAATAAQVTIVLDRGVLRSRNGRKTSASAPRPRTPMATSSPLRPRM